MYTELKTDRLLLRPVCAADAETMHAYTGDPDLTRYMIFLPHDSLSETESFLKQAEAEWQKDAPAFFEFTVLLDETQIGKFSIWLDETRTEGELGWLLHREYHGRGYALESASAVCRFAFETLHLQKLVAQCDARNTPSARLMEKLGMTLADDTGLRTYAKRTETARELTYILENPN